jgi:hypothetical protein
MKHKKLTTIVIGMSLLFSTQAAMAQRLTLVSVNGAGTGPGNGGSEGPSLSADGRFLAFSSTATDLVSNDTNGSIQDVFVRDMLTGTTTLVSVNSAGTGSGLGGSDMWRGGGISSDGRFVLFTSEADDIVANDDSKGPDLYIRDLVVGATTRIRASSRGPDYSPSPPSDYHMTPDGRFVVFSSSASDIVPGDRNKYIDAFVYDVSRHTTAAVSVNMYGNTTGNLYSGSAVISDNGLFVAFVSAASDLVPEDNNGFISDVFVRDLVLGATTLVSVNFTGMGGGNNHSSYPKISADGRKVAFLSRANDLTSYLDANANEDVFVRDLTMERTTLVSVSRRGRRTGNIFSLTVDISANGRFVIFSSWATDLTRDDPYQGFYARRCDLFVRDLESNETRNLSADIPLPVPLMTQRVLYHQISSDGHSLVFDWYSFDNSIKDVYFCDVATSKLTLMNINLKGARSISFSHGPVISADGRVGAFASYARDLTFNDSNNALDVFTFLPTTVNEITDNSASSFVR